MGLFVKEVSTADKDREGVLGNGRIKQEKNDVLSLRR